MRSLAVEKIQISDQKHRRSLARKRWARPGSLMLEVIVGAALLGSLLILINQMIVRLHRQTALTDQHYVAQQTLENLLEEFSSRSWDNLESTELNEMELPGFANSKLPRAEITGEVVEAAEPSPAKRITLRLAWQSDSGIEQRPLTLTTWVYKQVEDNP